MTANFEQVVVNNGLNPSKGREPIRTEATERVAGNLTQVLIPQRVGSLFGPRLSTAPPIALDRFRSRHFALARVAQTAFPRVCANRVISVHFNPSLIRFQALSPLNFAFDRAQSPQIAVSEPHTLPATQMPPVAAALGFAPTGP